jgi:hypothetical protein
MHIWNLVESGFQVRAKYWPCLGFETKKSGDLNCVTGSGNSEKAIKNLNSHDCFNNRSDDSSPMNYADLEHFSYNSSSSKSEFQSGDQTEGKG